jgi:hypothetical protein
MSAEREMSFASKLLPAGELRKALERVRDTVASPMAKTSLFRVRRLGDGTTRTDDNLPLSTLDDVCDLASPEFDVTLSFEEEKGRFRQLRAMINPNADGYLDVEFEAPNVEQLGKLIESFQRELGLERAPSYAARFAALLQQDREAAGKSLPAQIAEIAARVETVERRIETEAPQLTCFLSFQFVSPSIEYGREVQRFLELRGVRVVSGQGYEPKTIQEKVRSRLAEGIDVVVVIEAAARKSSWTRDEIAKAQSPDVFLIPLVEDGAVFDKGIFGDHEYLSFAPGHVGDTFVGLLEGIQYVQRERSARARRDVATGELNSPRSHDPSA